MTTPRILTLDIETSPNEAHVWGMFKQNIGLNQLLRRGQVFAFAAKWLDKKPVMFYSDFHDEHDEMVKAAHRLLDEADMVVHFNGQSFDIPHLNRQFLLAGMTPPSPYKQIDLLLAARKHFRFVSNKLDNLAQELGIGKKTGHTGHQLWVDCLAGDPKAWALMRKYNKQDVLLTEELYLRLLPWIENHPSVALYGPDERLAACNRCGSDKLEKRGLAHTSVSVFQQYKCNGCGGWLRASRRDRGLVVQGIR